MRNELISFLVGLIFGAGAAYLAVKDYFEKIANDEIEDVKRAYSGHMGAPEGQKEEDATDPYDNVPQSISNLYKDAGYKESITLTQYNKISQGNSVEDILVKEAHPSEDSPSIYLIEDGDFLQPGEHYDQKILTYYLEDGVLIDEQYNEVFDEMSWLDHGILDAFVDSQDKVIYMRNDDIMMDFEIVKEHGRWDG